MTKKTRNSYKNSPKIRVKTVLLTKLTILLSKKLKKRKMRDIVHNQILNFCIKNKTVTKILKRKFLFAKFRIMILDVAKARKTERKNKHQKC